MRYARCSSRAARRRACVARLKSWKTGRPGSRRRETADAAALITPRSYVGRHAGEQRMKIDVLTLFPEMFAGPLDVSIVARARKTGLLDLRVHNLRDWTHDRHKTVDDKPFGGGPGMLLKPEPIFEAVESLADEKTRVILLTPTGRP